MNSIAMSLISEPFPKVAISFGSLPETMALFQAHTEFPLVFFSISPSVKTFTVRLAFAICALIAISIGIELIAITVSLIFFPGAFIDPASVIDHNSFAVPLECFGVNFTPVD
jgi:hypothetical protein